ncbi:MAG: YfhO family protein [Nitrospinae bacterium]|nr:YfhO family protein [Nitrospinota bacterium]
MIFLFIFGFAYILFYFGKIRKIVFAALVLLLIIVDLNLKDFRLLPLIDRKFYEERPVLADALKDAYGKHRVYSGRIQQSSFSTLLPASNSLDGMLLLKQYLTPFTGMVYGIENAAGKAGLGMGISKQVIWVAAMKQADADGRLRILKRSNVGYWIDPNGENPLDSNGDPVISPDRIRVFKDALPRAYLVPGVRLAKDSQWLNAYYAEAFDPLQHVLLSEPVEFAPSNHFEGKVEEVSYRPNHVTVKTSQEGTGFLVLVDSYFPGWTVTVDGKEEKILRANYFYRAVQLGPGEHTLEFDYFPEGFKEGLIVSAFFLLILIALPLCKPFKRIPLPRSVPFPPDPGESP